VFRALGKLKESGSVTNKVRNMDFTYTVFEEVDLKKTLPWNLPST